MKIKVLIVDSDATYVEKLVSVFNAKYADKLQVLSFTSLEKAVAEIKDKKVDLCIVDKSMNIEDYPALKKNGLVYFIDRAGIEQVDDYKAINKYQKPDVIYRKILSIYSEIAPNIKIERNKEGGSKIVTFTSFSGGVGTSSAAVAYAIRKAQDYSVFYFNLEKLGDSNLFFSSNNSYTLSDIIYAIKSKKGNVEMKIESCLETSKERVNFIPSPSVALDFMELNNDEIVELINIIANMGYDYLVIDINFDFEKLEKKIMELADDIVLVLDGSEIGNSKFDRGYNVLKVLQDSGDIAFIGKLNLLYNQFSNKTCKKLVNLDIKEIGGIPRFEHATTEQVIESIANFEELDKIG